VPLPLPHALIARAAFGTYDLLMAKFRGTIRHSDLEGGHFQLVADDGSVYEVESEGNDPLLATDGARVEIDGSVDKDALSFTMTGPRLKVRAVKRA
jgi:hypothetical protein